MALALPPLSVAEWLGVLGFGISVCLAIIQMYNFFFLRPRLKVAPIADKVEIEHRKYGYLNIKVTNKGKMSAKECRLIATIDGQNFQHQGLFWRNPENRETDKAETITIHGDGDYYVSNIFELYSSYPEAHIVSMGERVGRLTVGKSYNIRFAVHCDPSAKGILNVRVDVKSWDNIAVKPDC